MPHCSKCGAMVAENVAFCPQCGQPVGTAAPAPAPAGGAQSQSQTGLSENVAGLLCYVLWWITGLVFFLIDKRPFVRFHAAQSMVLFGAITVLYWILGFVFMFTGFAGAMLMSMVYWLLWIGSIVLWILCMVKAYQGERFRVPIVADVADGLAK